MRGEDLLGKMVEVKYMGGRVRGEGKVVSYSEAPSVQVEYVDGTSESWLASLVDPKPAVSLPSVPTLGWLDSMGNDHTLGIWRRQPLTGGNGVANIRGEGNCALNFEITAFTPATAVPAEALDALRTYMAGLGVDTPTRRSVATFLAAVDNASTR